jgi:hypothetical protein
MLPRLLQWFDQTAIVRAMARRPHHQDDNLSSFMSDDKLSVTESSYTEFSRAMDALDQAADRRLS